MNKILLTSQDHRDQVRSNCKKLIAALGELETYPPDHRETAMHIVRRIDDLARKIRDAVLTGGGGF